MNLRYAFALTRKEPQAAPNSRGHRPSNRRGKSARSHPRPSSWVLAFDTETTTDAGQSLRFGSYQVREGDQLHEAGLFYDPMALSDHELAVLSEFAAPKGLRLITLEEFVDHVFYGIGYELRATIVGLNLPFDISRIAIGHASARGDDMRGGFSFRLSGDEHKPPVQVKHLSQKAALIRFTAPRRQRHARSERKRGDYVPVRRGHFVDVRTLAAALFSRSFSLQSLSGIPQGRTPKGCERRTWWTDHRVLCRLCPPRRAGDLGMLRRTRTPI